MTAPWVQLADLPTPVPDLPGGDEEWAATIAQASEVLWALSGRRWGGQRTLTYEVVAPAPAADLPPGWDHSWGVHPDLVDGQVVNHSCCPAPLQVRLPGTPVEVLDVTHSGVTRDPASYRLNGAWLEDRTRTGWPVCDPGIVATYLSGREPPEAGRRAAAIYARELGRARLGDPGCGLPANVTSITRQGITQTFMPASELIALGQTGLAPVDAWVATVNPSRLTRRARVWSPDITPRTYRRTAP